MFHPYWAKAGPGGDLPRDMAWGIHLDKANLRDLYHKCMVNYFGNNAAGQPNYQMPVSAPRHLHAPVVTNPKEGEATGSNPKGPKKPRKQRGPNKPKNAQATSESAKKRSAPYANEVSMTYPPNKRLATLNDGDSVKSESRGTSIIDSALGTPTRHEPDRSIDLTSTTPEGRSSADSLAAFDIPGMGEEMDRQTGGPSSSSPPSDDSAGAPLDNSSPPIDLVDDNYMNDQDGTEGLEQLLARWPEIREASLQQIVQGQGQGHVEGLLQGLHQNHASGTTPPPTSSSSPPSPTGRDRNHGETLHNSIEIDGHSDSQSQSPSQEQNAQIQPRLHQASSTTPPTSSSSSSSPTGRDRNQGETTHNSIGIDDDDSTSQLQSQSQSQSRSKSQSYSQSQEQNAQIPPRLLLPHLHLQGRDGGRVSESENTVVNVDSDQDTDMQMISTGMGTGQDEVKVMDDEDFEWTMMGKGGEGATVGDAILLD